MDFDMYILCDFLERMTALREIIFPRWFGTVVSARAPYGTKRFDLLPLECHQIS